MAANMYRVGGMYTSVGLLGAEARSGCSARRSPGIEPLAGLRYRGRGAAAAPGPGLGAAR